MVRNFRRTVLFCAVIGGLHATAFAQETTAVPASEQSVPAQPAPQQAPVAATEPAAATATAKDLDKVVVVGSRLAGNSETGMAPVVVLGEEDIANTGAVSGEELLHELQELRGVVDDRNACHGERPP